MITRREFGKTAAVAAAGMVLSQTAKSYAQIAEAVGVSYKTVANTSSLMKQKLAVETTADLIRLSIESRKK